MAPNKLTKNKNKAQAAKTPAKMKNPPRRMPFLKQVNAPVSAGTVRSASRNLPLGQIRPNGAIIKNFEQVATFVGGTSGFRIDGAILNPGLPLSFPWLSGLANNYQKFKFHYLRYFYSSAVSTSTAGSAFLELQYDYLDAPPGSLVSVAASDTSSIGPVWFGGTVNQEKAFDTSVNGDANVFLDMDCSKFNNQWFFVRTTNGGIAPTSGGALGGVIPAGLTFTPGGVNDPEAIPGRIYYGTNGVAGSNPGYLYAAYICEFVEPTDPNINN
jgi:hypothetical protein